MGAQKTGLVLSRRAVQKEKPRWFYTWWNPWYVRLKALRPKARGRKEVESCCI